MASSQILDVVPWLMLAKLTGLLLVLFCVSLLLRGRSERLRYQLWMAGFVALFLLPVMSAHMPWKLELIPGAVGEVARPTTTVLTETPQMESREMGVDIPGTTATPTTLERTRAVEERPTSSGVVPRAVTAGEVILSIWALGAIVVLLRFVLGSVALARLMRRAAPHTGLATLTDSLAREMGIGGPVRVRVSATASMPVTWSVLRPVIMLPRDAEAWPSERQKAVILHELAHVRRHDALGLILTQLVCALYWFHPLVWLAVRQLNLARECACDAMAIGTGVPSNRYALHLVAVARGLRPRTAALGMLPMARRSQLRQRLRIILEGGAGATVSRRLAGVVVALTTIATSAVAAFSPQSQEALVGEAVPIEDLSRTAPVERITQDRDARPAGEQDRAGVVSRAWEDRDWGDRDSLRIAGDRFFQNGDQSYVSRNNDYMIGRWRVESSQLGLEIKGTVHVSSDDRRLHSLSPGGYFVIEERRDGGRRRYEARTGADGRLEQAVYENERASELGGFDAWLGRMILATVRRTGIDAAERTARILREAGVDGVFEEIDALTSNHVRVLYFQELIENGDLDESGLGRAVGKIATTITSSGDKSRVLIRVADKYTGDLELARKFLEASETISSDGDRSRLLHALLGRPGLDDSVAVLALTSIAGVSGSGDKSRLLIDAASRFTVGETTSAAYFGAAAGIDSSGDLSRVLSAVLEANSDHPRTVVLALESVQGISSDGDKSRVLSEMLDRADLDDRNSGAFFDAANSIDSAGDRSRVLISAIGEADLSDNVQRKILQSARDLRTAGALSRVLVSFSESYRVTDANGHDYFNAVGAIDSSGDRARVLISVADQGDLAKGVVLQVLEAARAIASNGEKTRALIAVAVRCRGDGDLRAAYVEAVDSISSRGDRRRALRAIDG